MLLREIIRNDYSATSGVLVTCTKCAHWWVWAETSRQAWHRGAHHARACHDYTGHDTPKKTGSAAESIRTTAP